MPDENIEVLDDFILDMDIETITLDDMEFKEPAELPEVVEETESPEDEMKGAGQTKFGSINNKIDLSSGNIPGGININLNGGLSGAFSGNNQKEEKAEISSAKEQNISIGTLNIFNETPEPDLPKEKPIIDEISPSSKLKETDMKNDSVFESEDDIISIDGSELDKMIYGSELPSGNEFPSNDFPSNKPPIENNFSSDLEIEEGPAIFEKEEMNKAPAAPIPEEHPEEKIKSGIEKIEEVPVIEKAMVDEEAPEIYETEKEEELIPISEIGVESFEIPSEESPVEEQRIPSPEFTGNEKEAPEIKSEAEPVPLPEETISAEEPISTLGIQPVSTEFIATEEQLSEKVEQPEIIEFNLNEPFAEERIDLEEIGSSKESEQAAPEIQESVEAAPPQAEAEDFSFDLSVIPDVAEIEEDEPIALSLDELNNIDISEVSPAENAELPEELRTSEEVSIKEEIPYAEEVAEMKIKPSIEESIQLVEEPIGRFEFKEEVKPETTVEKQEIQLEELNKMQEDITEQRKPDIMPEFAESETAKPAFDEAKAIVEKEIKEKIIDENIGNLSLETKDELKSVLSYLDNLLENLPEDKIKQFAKSDYYDLYVKILDKLGI